MKFRNKYKHILAINRLVACDFKQLIVQSCGLLVSSYEFVSKGLLVEPNCMYTTELLRAAISTYSI